MSRIKLFFLIIVSSFLSSYINNAYSQAPTITSQPNQVVECIASFASIKIVATGAEPLTYQWYQGSTPVGTNDSELNFAALSTADEGIYTCEVSNAEGSLTSEECEVFVIDGIPVFNEITTENDLVCIGTDNLLEVDFTGEMMNRIWYLEGDLIGYTNQYQIIDAQLDDEGNYYCIASNACGETISDTININIIEHANITSQPTTQTICEGSDVEFLATAEGDYLNYMWLENESLIIGETESTLTITDLAYPNTTEYKLVAYNVCNNDTSNGVFINVNTFPEIESQPIDHQGCLGADISLYAFATATTENSYQWYDGSFSPIIGETESEIEINLTSTDNTYYYCAITNICGTVYTDTAELTSFTPPIITQQPVGGTYCANEDVELQIKANGTAPLSYQWLFNNSDVYGINISGDESDNLIISGITEGQLGIYTCHVTNLCGSVISDTAELIVNTPPVVTEQPENIEICENEELLIDISYTGTEPISFEWYILETGELIGTNADFYSELANPNNSGSYYCLLSNSCEEISTDTISISILALPQVTTHPEDEAVCEGEYASMEVEATGAETLDYLWYRNESPVSGQTNSILDYPAAQVNQTGIYFCRVSNECGYDDSGTAELTIGTEPAITWNPIDQTLCEHDTLNLIMDAQGDNYTLQWYFNDMPIPEQNDTVLNFVYVDESWEGEYYCIAYNSCATVYSDTAVVIINPAPEMTLGDDIDLCAGQDTTLQTVGNFIHYNWNNGLSYQPDLEVQLGGTFVLEVTGENSCKTRDSIVVTYHPYHNILFGSENIIACGPYELNAGEGGYNYIWNTAPPQTSSSINITQTGTYTVTVSGDSFGCTSTSSVNVDVREPVEIDLGEDISVPVSSFTDIGVDPEYNSYIWNTGFSGPLLSVYGSAYGLGDHEFWLTVIAENSCTDTDTIIVSFWDDSSISENSLNSNLEIYPNPSTGIITISIDDNNISAIDIYNSIGELVKSTTINSDNISLDLHDFGKGIYMVKARCEDKVFTKKILIK